MGPPPIDHDCALKEYVVKQSDLLAKQSETIAKLEHELAQMKSALLGSRSESKKMPRVNKQPVSKEQQQATRKENKEKKEQAPTITTHHKVEEEKRCCPKCGNKNLSPLGSGKETTVWEFVPARFIKHVHVQEILRCQCNEHVVTADGAPKIIEGGQYGASFMAHLAVAKCADHLPIYRLEKEFARVGVPIARSTMNDLFYKTADITRPLWELLLKKICSRKVVMADETRLRMLKDAKQKPKNGFVWTFCAVDNNKAKDIAYVFAASRENHTPKNLLEGTSGVLLTDGYSGYNVVQEVSSRTRAACHAHLRRYFFEAKDTSPQAQEALDIISQIYHAPSRKDALVFREQLWTWIEKQQVNELPKGPLGSALRYAKNQWQALGVCFEDDDVPLDNNASENALRRIALGRKNFLFVHDEKSGEKLCGLYSLVATCEARGINPFDYLTDVITRIQDHPANKIEELLPGAWQAEN